MAYKVQAKGGTFKPGQISSTVATQQENMQEMEKSMEMVGRSIDRDGKTNLQNAKQVGKDWVNYQRPLVVYLRRELRDRKNKT